MRPNILSSFNTSDQDENIVLYQPLLSWAEKYDRGVGYFTSGWLKKNTESMASFVVNRGKARWITSPILDDLDVEMFNNIEKYKERFDNINIYVENSIDEIFDNITEKTREFLAWMIYDGIVEIRFAVPTNKLSGDFHDKFGIGYNGDDVISFNGSQNDSIKGTTNYESFKVFASWKGHEEFIKDDIQRFERLWSNVDDNVKVYKLSTAIKDKIFKKRSSERPYNIDKQDVDKWRHQEEALETFLSNGNGILEMATGSGKTRTALMIAKRMYELRTIDRVVICTYGTDLLNQWDEELIKDHNFDEWLIYKKYDKYNEIGQFYTSPRHSILIVSRTTDNLLYLIGKMSDEQLDRTLIIFDEIHGLGSSSLQSNLTGKISKIRYRLGLSATPEREYDGEGSNFIVNEVGEVIYRFTLEDAIKRGILCEFDYKEIEYGLTAEEKKNITAIIAKYDKKKKLGELYREEDKWREIANVRKLAANKIIQFEEFIKKNLYLLDYCIIFVHTSEYGMKVQEILIKYISDYHVYYAETDESHLDLFANGETQVLITCKKLNEGIDIKKCKNIILFSSDRSKLVTIQRIGRCLRTTNDPNKVASVVDFIDSESTADIERSEWINKIAEIRRESNGN